MSKQFKTAEELMDYLKQQIVRYNNGEDIDEFEIQNANDNQVSERLDLSRLLVEREANNLLWNVSAERPITSHRKIIGRFIVFGKKIARKLLRWYVSKTFEMQSDFNGSVTRSINEISNALQVLSAQVGKLESQVELNMQQKSSSDNLYDLQRRFKVLMENINVLSHQLKEADKSLYDSIEVLKANIVEITDRFENNVSEMTNKIESNISEITSKVESNASAINQCHNQLNRIAVLESDFNKNQVSQNQRFNHLEHKYNNIEEQIRNENNFINYRIRKLTRNSKLEDTKDNNKTNLDFAGEKAISNEVTGDFDYLHFENRFRGSIEEIKKRQEVYLPYFQTASEVLDIGCGRGEFLELMIENNIKVTGIDINDEMVEYCQDRGLPVIKADATKYLSKVEDSSLGGIFLGQVIEHMPFDQIIVLVENAYRKLKPGSYLIMESPNPLSLAIFYRTFYVDPTHIKPVHPLTVQYIVESVGFSKTELQYSSRVEPNWWLPNLNVNENVIPNIQQFNEGIERINNLLYGHLDYAIIARK